MHCPAMRQELLDAFCGPEVNLLSQTGQYSYRANRQYRPFQEPRLRAIEVDVEYQPGWGVKITAWRAG
jgi:hypothetical protein